MGVYDSVKIPCPVCGKRELVQTKAGDCCLAEFTLDDAPAPVLASLEGEQITCRECNTMFVVRVTVVPRIEIIPGGVEEHERPW